MASKPGAKYYPLFRYLQERAGQAVILEFEEIEGLIGEALPPSARQSDAFWSNRTSGGYQAAAWMDAGFHIEHVDLAEERVEFKPAEIEYEVRREGGSIRWDGDMIRALRAHLDVNQEELAEILGVRQQTVSEWENEIYKPSRSRSKHLTLVAERAEFPFGAGTGKAT